ncbi:MAG: PD-(D/E)XK nuclease family protein [Elusimicrobiota bacterium]
MNYKESKYPMWCWSSSRKRTFLECKRKYYYNYYLSHNGWNEDAPDDSKKAYRLKKLTGIHLLLGIAVHEVAEYTCKIISSMNKKPDKKTLIDKVRFILNKAWKESKKPHLWFNQPNRYFMLHEFYYGDGLSSSIINKVKEKMYNTVPNILHSGTVNNLLDSDDCNIKISEDMDTFDVQGTPIYAVPDLVYENGEGKWVVVDWKSGKEHDSHPRQINVYSLYLTEKFGIEPEDIIGKMEYLLTGKCLNINVTRETVEQARSDIIKSIKEMQQYLLDKEKNIPVEMEKFPLTKHPRLCRWCNFYEMDKQEINCILSR